MIGINHLGIIDFAVVAITLLFSLFIGIFYGFCSKKQTSEDLLVGGRKMGNLPVAASMLVSYLSAITILGFPSEVYQHGIQIFMFSLHGIVTYPLSIYLFVSVLYKLKLTSCFKYLELRFDSVIVRWIGSLAFMLQLIFITGIVLYAPSLALEAMVGLPTWISIIGIGICGTIYTSIGGLKAVVWTDVFQFVMIFLGMSAIVLKGFFSAGGLVNALQLASFRGRLELFNFTLDPLMRHNTFNILIGNGFAAICLVGTSQQLVQRYCSLPTYKDAVKSILWSWLFGVVTIFVVIITGLAVFATYADCDPVMSGQISKIDQILPYFVIRELSFIPGMMGLFVSVIFSAVLSTISSTLNSLAAVTMEDFVLKVPCFRNMSDNGKAWMYKIISAFYGVVCVLVAFSAENFGTILQAAITISGTIGGVLGSTFLMGVFIPAVNKYGAISGMLSGMICMGFLSVKAMMLQTTVRFQEPLVANIDKCPADIIVNTTLAAVVNLTSVDSLEWPTKIFTVSYVLYPVIGAIITIGVGVFVSIFTEGCQHAPDVSLEYTHPIIHPQLPKNKREQNGLNNENYKMTNKKEEVNMGYVENDDERDK